MVTRHRIIGTAIALLLLALPATAAATPGGKGKGKPTVGARTLGDPLLPQIGNGGYDAEHYRIELDYDPVANVFNSAKTKIDATAEAKLKEFSLDFQDLDVSSVKVDGRRGRVQPGRRHPATEPDPRGHPADEAGRAAAAVEPAEGGPRIHGQGQLLGSAGADHRRRHLDRGLDPRLLPARPPQTCDGAFVVGEPIGAQSWFPSNNYPTDKATFDTLISVPQREDRARGRRARRQRDNGDGTITWHWREDDPTATYLMTATSGDFNFTWLDGRDSTGRTLPVYNAVDSSATPGPAGGDQASLDQAPGQVNFLGGLYGPYPFDSTGAVADRAAGVGYALEVQSKPHYAGGFTSGNPSIDVGTQLHELAHQWVGNSVTLETWADIWFNEGWANWSRVVLGVPDQGGDDPAAIWDDLYANTPAEDWEARRRSSTAIRPACSASSRPTNAGR